MGSIRSSWLRYPVILSLEMAHNIRTVLSTTSDMSWSNLWILSTRSFWMRWLSNVLCLYHIAWLTSTIRWLTFDMHVLTLMVRKSSSLGCILRWGWDVAILAAFLYCLQPLWRSSKRIIEIVLSAYLDGVIVVHLMTLSVLIANEGPTIVLLEKILSHILHSFLILRNLLLNIVNLIRFNDAVIFLNFLYFYIWSLVWWLLIIGAAIELLR